MDAEAVSRSYAASPAEGVLRGAAEWVAVAGVLFGFHVFTVEYVHSSFLSEFFSRTVVGLLMTATSFVSLSALVLAPRVLARVGAYRLAFTATLACAGSSLVLGFVQEWPMVIVGAFTVLAVSAPLVLLCLDVFLEHAIRNEAVTGTVRGRHLAAVMGSALLSPLIAGTLAGSGERLALVYLASACFLLPFLLVLTARLRYAGEAAHHPAVSLGATLRRVAKTGDLLHVAAAQFLLRFYFAWMVVYLPLYLHQSIGFSWGDIGLVLSFMLVPYLLEWPAGVVADRWLGEQELLAAGFTIIALSTAVVPFLGTGSVLAWGALLCVTRVGAALIESMTEVHFFKRVDATDVELVSFFRMLRPLAFTLGPLLATMVLYVVDLRFLWLVLAVVMLTGIIHAARLVDTR